MAIITQYMTLNMIWELRIKISQFCYYNTIFDKKYDLRFEIWESRSASFVIITKYLTRNMIWDLRIGKLSVIAKVGLATFRQYPFWKLRFENLYWPIRSLLHHIGQQKCLWIEICEFGYYYTIFGKKHDLRFEIWEF